MGGIRICPKVVNLEILRSLPYQMLDQVDASGNMLNNLSLAVSLK